MRKRTKVKGILAKITDQETQITDQETKVMDQETTFLLLKPLKD